MKRIATAHRRQESPPPPEINSSPALIISPESLEVYGSLSSGGDSLALGPETGDSQLTASYSYTPGVDAVTNARVTLTSAPAGPVSWLRVLQCVQDIHSNGRWSSRTRTCPLTRSWRSKHVVQQIRCPIPPGSQCSSFILCSLSDRSLASCALPQFPSAVSHSIIYFLSQCTHG